MTEITFEEQRYLFRPKHSEETKLNLKNIVRESLGIKKTQKQLQREWYIKNRERILAKQGVKHIGKNSRF